LIDVITVRLAKSKAARIDLNTRAAMNFGSCMGNWLFPDHHGITSKSLTLVWDVKKAYTWAFEPRFHCKGLAMRFLIRSNCFLSATPSRPSVVILLFFSLMLTALLSAPAHGELIKIGGTGSALATMRIMAEEFLKANEGDNVVVLPSLGSGGGIKAVLDGAIDIGLSTRSLVNEERAQGVAETTYGKTPFVFAVYQENMTTGFTTSNLVDIYSGKTQTWPDGMLIRLIMRSEREKDTVVLKSISPEMKQAVESALSRKGMIFTTTDQETADKIIEVPGVLSTATLALIISEKRPIRALALDGAKPTTEAIVDGSYPLSITFRFVTKKEPSQLARRFIDFVHSEIGRSILLRNGTVAEKN